ncbi:MAG: tRNA lysidine(34) synthetase TilS [Bacteroidetes bacterium]|nr:tRNA lysidine(34) synthetase TilS [Bacteroidota bacterium]
MNKNKSLLQKFQEFNADNRMASRKKKTILAVSGGVDSVVMCDLFHQAEFPFVIAHCNFQLRGIESDEDESFVKRLAEKYSVVVFVKRFNTKEYSEENKLSIQLAARQLRYEWFEDLRKEKDFQLVATAHQLNDNIETIFYNLIKGTGIRGLRGIPVRQGNVVRPILFASREEIESYMKEYQLAYREDSSNAEDKYMRNKIRHHLIPLMKEINPSLEKTISEKIAVWSELEALYNRSVSKSSAQLFIPRRNDIYIPILKLKKTKNISTVLYEYLKDYGFNAAQVNDMLTNLDDIPGKQFLTSTARVIKDRRFFILTRLPEQDFTIRLIDDQDVEVSLGEKKLLMERIEINSPPSELKLATTSNVVHIDMGKLTFRSLSAGGNPAITSIPSE